MPDQFVRNGSMYGFEWSPVLNQYGVLGPYSVAVDVDGLTGEIVGDSILLDTSITGPTVPQVTQDQARHIAIPWAAYDLDQVPFSEVVLRLDRDLVGIQRLRWILRQYPTPNDDPSDHFGVCIDAITGAVTGLETRMGLAADKRARRLPPLPRYVRLFQGAARSNEVRSTVFPVIEKGLTWIRVEMLRGFDARVNTDREGALVRAGDQTLTAAQVGGKWRDHGWWVPLRRAAETLGWQVAWHPRTKEVHVTTKPGGIGEQRPDPHR